MSFDFANGGGDVYLVCDLPDDEAAAAITLTVGASGALSTFKLTKLFSAEQIEAAAAHNAKYVPPEQLSPGFCGGYWLGDPATGAGLDLSFWTGPAEGRAGNPDRHRERDRDQGLTVERIAVYESIGAAGPLHADTGDPLP